jgi:hypothetical protein
MINFNTYNTERLLIKQFKETFRHRTEIGAEYFEGSPVMMMDIIYNMCRNIMELVPLKRYNQIFMMQSTKHTKLIKI